MNPRRVHELMREHFPDRPASASGWVVASDEQGLRVEVLRRLVSQHIGSHELVVEANRKAGDLLSLDQALEFVAQHLGRGRIRLSNRLFSGFVVIELNGVASGWAR